jgi:hypothetical protein
MLGKAGLATLAAAGGAAVLAQPAAAVDLSVVLLPIGPLRVYDTREGPGRLNAGEERTLTGGAAPEEIAHLYNVTLAETTGAGGFVAVFPGNISWPGTSSLNWFGPNQTIANNAYTLLGDETEPSIKLRAGGPPGASTHVILDLVGTLVVLDLDPTAEGARALSARLGASAPRQLREV